MPPVPENHETKFPERTTRVNSSKIHGSLSAGPSFPADFSRPGGLRFPSQSIAAGAEKHLAAKQKGVTFPSRR